MTPWKFLLIDLLVEQRGLIYSMVRPYEPTSPIVKLYWSSILAVRATLRLLKRIYRLLVYFKVAREGMGCTNYNRQNKTMPTNSMAKLINVRRQPIWKKSRKV